MDMFILPLVALTVGAALGFFGGFFGIGGGVIALPILALGFGMDQTTAQGTALAMMAPNLIMAWWRYAKRNPVGMGWQSALVAAAATLTTWAAARFAQGLDPRHLQHLCAGFLMLLGLGQLLPARFRFAPRTPADPRLMPLVGVLGGSSMGLLGIGGGLVATPVLNGLFGLGQRGAQSVALALVTPSAAVALLNYAEHQNVDWTIGLCLALGGVATVSAGVALAHSIPERRLQQMFGLMVAFMGLLLGLKA